MDANVVLVSMEIALISARVFLRFQLRERSKVCLFFRTSLKETIEIIFFAIFLNLIRLFAQIKSIKCLGGTSQPCLALCIGNLQIC